MESKEGTEGTVKKRRRAGWDAPATTSIPLPSPSSSALMSGAQISSTSSMAPMISQAQQQAQVQMLLAQQALAQSLAAAAAASSSSAANMVQLSQQSSFVMPMATPPPPPAPTGPTRLDCRLYIGSLHYSITEADIRALFSGFGTVTRIDMSFEPTSGNIPFNTPYSIMQANVKRTNTPSFVISFTLGKSKGFCFLEFADPMSIYAGMYSYYYIPLFKSGIDSLRI